MCKVIAVSNQKGGVGKSSIVMCSIPAHYVDMNILRHSL